MNYVTIIFSPTGGTEKVTAVLTSPWGKAEQSVDLTNSEMDFSSIAFQAEDVVVIAVPSYGGRVPGLAAKRIQQIHGNGAHAVLVCVYGNRAYEDTLVELEDLAQGAGFQVTAAVAAVAEHSIVRHIAAGRPDTEDQATLTDLGQAIRERLQNDGKAEHIPGNRPYKKSGGGLIPQTGESCIQCGQCADRCPSRAIDPADARKIEPSKCIGCMRCVTICPQHAKALDASQLTGIEAMLVEICSERKPCELY